MRVNGTLINYYFHCKRQCYLHGNRLNLEDNSEIVQIGKAIHEERLQSSNSEIAIENIKLDKLTKEYLTEEKKSDADVEAEVEKMAAAYGMEVDKIKDYIQDAEKESMKKDIAIEKAVSFIMDNVKERAKRTTKKAAADDTKETAKKPAAKKTTAKKTTKKADETKDAE